MEMYAITVGPIQENCYFLIGDHENDTIIFDPGEQLRTSSQPSKRMRCIR